MKSQKQKLLLIVSGTLWLAAVAVGLWILFRYENTPGLAAASPEFWPVESNVKRTQDRSTLIMLAHPHCPCTRASLGELDLLMAECQGLINAHVIFIRPEGFTDEWPRTDLWQSAAAIPGVTVRQDDGGIEARRFNAETSGQVLLYDATGRLLFSGGITSSRGHSGDNAGRSAIVSLLTTAGITGINQTPVFGCALFNESCTSQTQEP
ncbi:MAG: RedB protein [Acidobacteriota bacterium]